MILYLGTSSLVKLYIEEDYSDIVAEWVKEAEIVVTCRIAYTEMMAALEMRFRRKDISLSDYNMVVKGFSRDWNHYVVLDFDEIEAGRLVKKYGLRRFDAIHLSSAKLLKSKKNDIHLSFSSADEKLCRAAAAEGLRVLTFS